MLQKLLDDIKNGLVRIEEARGNLLTLLGEDLATAKKAGEWKTTFAEELSGIKERKDSLKENNRIVKRWQEMETRRSEVRKEVQELEASYGNIRGELEISFEDIGIAAFELYQKAPSSFDEAADLLEDMQDLESGIREKELELQQLRSDVKPGSFLSKTLRKGKGIVIKGSLKTRELQRGKRLKLVGEHICESGILSSLPEGSNLAKQLAPLSKTTAALKDTKQRLDDAKSEVEAIDNERITIERGARMRNPVRNLQHEIHKLETELREMYSRLGNEYFASPRADQSPSERISRSISQLERNDEDKKSYEKLKDRVEAALAIASLESEKEKLEKEQKVLSERIDALERSKSDIQTDIEKMAKTRGNPETLILPEIK